MQAFSWEMAESLAAAHMRALGFHDARTTSSGADKGIDVISTGAAAQVKALQVPVGAPDVQKLKGSAHLLENQLFYSLSGYTDQAVRFSETAAVALFTFDTQNNVEPANSFAATLAAQIGNDPELAEARVILKQVTDQYASMGALMRYLMEWVADTPWGLGAPPELATKLLMPAMEITASSMTLPDADNVQEVTKWSKKALAKNQKVITHIGEILGLNFSGLDSVGAIERLEGVRHGDLVGFRVPQHLLPLVEKHSTHLLGWAYLSQVNHEVKDVQKFLKLLTETKHRIEATGAEWADGTVVEKDWQAAIKVAAKFQNWANQAYVDEIKSIEEGKNLFAELRKATGKVCAFHGCDVESIYEEALAKPISWLNEEDEDD